MNINITPRVIVVAFTGVRYFLLNYGDFTISVYPYEVRHQFDETFSNPFRTIDCILEMLIFGGFNRIVRIFGSLETTDLCIDTIECVLEGFRFTICYDSTTMQSKQVGYELDDIRMCFRFIIQQTIVNSPVIEVFRITQELNEIISFVVIRIHSIKSAEVLLFKTAGGEFRQVLSEIREISTSCGNQRIRLHYVS